VLILAPEAYLPLRQLGTQFHAAADGVAATGKVLAVLDTPVPPSGTRTELPAVPGFRLDAMTVGAVGERGTVGPLSLTIPAGAVTVVTGDSGAGKTTLLQVLAGVQRPGTGRVLITWPPVQPTPHDDSDLAEIDPAAWRSVLSWAGQGAAMQAGSIRDNLALGNPAADDVTLRAALAAADATGFIDELPAGWNTELGEGGAGLSQGQRQRLALARALARPSTVLLLDEPTASLDEGTEKRVLAGIRTAAAGRTVVLVTHRTAPLALADHSIHLRPADHPAEDLPADDVEALAVGPW
jgi:ATP-binding cassette subfamily C protein CydD